MLFLPCLSILACPALLTDETWLVCLQAFSHMLQRWLTA